jgi:hypothetical protein
MTGVVMFLRLKNGDDIVSECYQYEDDNGRYYVLMNPLKGLYMTSNRGAGYLQVAFVPWVYSKLCDTQEFVIDAVEVMLTHSVSDYMEEYYWNSIDHLTGVSEEQPQEPESRTDLDRIKEVLDELAENREKKVYH